jgi:hypothetical protein
LIDIWQGAVYKTKINVPRIIQQISNTINGFSILNDRVWIPFNSSNIYKQPTCQANLNLFCTNPVNIPSEYSFIVSCKYTQSSNFWYMKLTISKYHDRVIYTTRTHVPPHIGQPYAHRLIHQNSLSLWLGEVVEPGEAKAEVCRWHLMHCTVEVNKVTKKKTCIFLLKISHQFIDWANISCHLFTVLIFCH